MKYLPTIIIALTLGFSFLGFQYWWYLPTPPEPVIYAFYWPKDIDYAITARASECGLVDGVYAFKSLDHPTGWSFISMQELYYGRCLDNEVTSHSTATPDSTMRLN